MELDKNHFFYEITSRICGSLKIELGLERTFEYIKDILPVDDIYLGLHDIYANSYHILAHANRSGGHTDRRFWETNKTTLPLLNSFTSNKQTLIVDDCNSEPVIKTFYPPEAYEGSSAMIVPLSLERSMLGVLVLFARGQGVYTAEHAELMGLVTMPFAIAIANARKYIELTRLKEDLLEENIALKNKISQHSDVELIGKEKGLKNVFEMINPVAPLKNPILILGETGTGKEVIANAIHSLSDRNSGPSIKVNCGAIAPSLLDSELFGHERGAFTGAEGLKKGKFERASGGTIFLDEIGELSQDAQVRLLRVIQENEIERVGGTEMIKVDLRVIAATHRDLGKMVQEGQFREDLYFRLSVFPIMVPPLRERREDIPELLAYFIRKKCHELKSGIVPEITEDALRNLVSYDWPGNIRELQNVVERALILERNKELLTFKNLIPESPVSKDGRGFSSLQEVEKAHIQRALELSDGKISGPTGAAALLSVNPSTLRNKMYKLGLL